MMEIPREAQDEFAISSYKKSQASAAAGIFQKEITPVTIKQRKGTSVYSLSCENERSSAEKNKVVYKTLTDNLQFLVWPVHRTFARQSHKIV